MAVLVASPERSAREPGWRPRFQSLGQIVGPSWEWMLAHPDGYGGL